MIRTLHPLCLLALSAAAILTGCAPAPPRPEPARTDPTKAAWYAVTVEQLAVLNGEAESLLKKGDAEQAGAMIATGQPLANRLLSVPRPTLSAMEAASDLESLYGRILLSKGQLGWARLSFQKNVARWRNWTPQTPETARRLKKAQAAVAECDRRLAE